MLCANVRTCLNNEQSPLLDDPAVLNLTILLVLKKESSLAMNPGISDLDEAEIDLTQLTKSSLTTNPLTRNSNDNDILLPVPCTE